MRRIGFALVVLGLASLAAPVMAEQVIHFTNGSSMPIRAHRTEDGMVHVDLGGDGFMAFPEYLIEKIVDAKGVKLEPSTGATNSRAPMRATSRTETTGVQRGANRYSQQNPGGSDTVMSDANGTAVVRPLQGRGRAASKLQIAAKPHLTNAPYVNAGAEGLRGSVRTGDHYVAPSGQPIPRSMQMVGITEKDGAAPTNVFQRRNANANANSQNNAQNGNSGGSDAQGGPEADK